MTRRCVHDTREELVSVGVCAHARGHYCMTRRCAHVARQEALVSVGP